MTDKILNLDKWSVDPSTHHLDHSFLPPLPDRQNLPGTPEINPIDSYVSYAETQRMREDLARLPVSMQDYNLGARTVWEPNGSYKFTQETLTTLNEVFLVWPAVVSVFVGVATKNPRLGLEVFTKLQLVLGGPVLPLIQVSHKYLGNEFDKVEIQSTLGTFADEFQSVDWQDTYVSKQEFMESPEFQEFVSHVFQEWNPDFIESQKLGAMIYGMVEEGVKEKSGGRVLLRDVKKLFTTDLSPEEKRALQRSALERYSDEAERQSQLEGKVKPWATEEDVMSLMTDSAIKKTPDVSKILDGADQFSEGVDDFNEPRGFDRDYQFQDGLADLTRVAEIGKIIDPSNARDYQRAIMALSAVQTMAGAYQAIQVGVTATGYTGNPYIGLALGAVSLAAAFMNQGSGNNGMADAIKGLFKAIEKMYSGIVSQITKLRQEVQQQYKQLYELQILLFSEIMDEFEKVHYDNANINFNVLRLHELGERILEEVKRHQQSEKTVRQDSLRTAFRSSRDQYEFSQDPESYLSLSDILSARRSYKTSYDMIRGHVDFTGNGVLPAGVTLPLPQATRLTVDELRRAGHLDNVDLLIDYYATFKNVTKKEGDSHLSRTDLFSVRGSAHPGHVSPALWQEGISVMMAGQEETEARFPETVGQVARVWRKQDAESLRAEGLRLDDDIDQIQSDEDFFDRLITDKVDKTKTMQGMRYDVAELKKEIQAVRHRMAYREWTIANIGIGVKLLRAIDSKNTSYQSLEKRFLAYRGPLNNRKSLASIQWNDLDRLWRDVLKAFQTSKVRIKGHEKDKTVTHKMRDRATTNLEAETKRGWPDEIDFVFPGIKFVEGIVSDQTVKSIRDHLHEAAKRQGITVVELLDTLKLGFASEVTRGGVYVEKPVGPNAYGKTQTFPGSEGEWKGMKINTPTRLFTEFDDIQFRFEAEYSVGISLTIDGYKGKPKGRVEVESYAASRKVDHKMKPFDYERRIYNTYPQGLTYQVELFCDDKKRCKDEFKKVVKLADEFAKDFDTETLGKHFTATTPTTPQYGWEHWYQSPAAIEATKQLVAVAATGTDQSEKMLDTLGFNSSASNLLMKVSRRLEQIEDKSILLDSYTALAFPESYASNFSLRSLFNGDGRILDRNLLLTFLSEEPGEVRYSGEEEAQPDRVEHDYGRFLDWCDGRLQVLQSHLKHVMDDIEEHNDFVTQMKSEERWINGEGFLNEEGDPVPLDEEIEDNPYIDLGLKQLDTYIKENF
jgi:hypothetical protein